MIIFCTKQPIGVSCAIKRHAIICESLYRQGRRNLYQTPFEREQAIQKSITDLKKRSDKLRTNIDQLKSELEKCSGEKLKLETKANDVEVELENIRQNRNDLKVRISEIDFALSNFCFYQIAIKQNARTYALLILLKVQNIFGQVPKPKMTFYHFGSAQSQPNHFGPKEGWGTKSSLFYLRHKKPNLFSSFFSVWGIAQLAERMQWPQF